METLQRCTPMPFTDGMGGAVAGRPFAIQFHNRKPPLQPSREESMADTENTLILETTQGPVTIEMRPDLAPGHVARIKELVREGFYDGIVFHRVIDGFMAQTGCPQGTGTGGSGKKLKAEFNKEPHVRGTTSMARAASPDSGDSQFFICFDDASLPQQPVHGLGQGHRGHGERRQDQARRAGARIPTRSSRRTWRPTRRNSHGHYGMRVAQTRESMKSSAFGASSLERRSRMRRRAEDAHLNAMRTDLFDFELPAREHRAAPGEPARFRAACWWCSRTACCAIAASPNCRDWLEAGDQLVVNDTKVIAAQLTGRRIGRETEPKIEATLIKRLDGSRWQALVQAREEAGAGRCRSLRQ